MSERVFERANHHARSSAHWCAITAFPATQAVAAAHSLALPRSHHVACGRCTSDRRSPGGRRDVAFGIDIGGSGMKAAPVDLETGELAADRFKILTPKPAAPEPMADVVRQLVEHFDWQGKRRRDVPRHRPRRRGPQRRQPRQGVGRHSTSTPCSPRRRDGRSTSSTTPTPPASPRCATGPGAAATAWCSCSRSAPGIGSGLFLDGVLVPNTELGHLEVDGQDAESRAAASAKERERPVLEGVGRARRALPAPAWSFLFSPELIIVGGGASRKADKWLPLHRRRRRDRARHARPTRPASSARRSSPTRRSAADAARRTPARRVEGAKPMAPAASHSVRTGPVPERSPSRWRALAALLRPDALRWALLGALIAASSAGAIAGPLVVREVVDTATEGTTAGEIARLGAAVPRDRRGDAGDRRRSWFVEPPSRPGASPTSCASTSPATCSASTTSSTAATHPAS